MESMLEELNKLFFKIMNKIVLITGGAKGIGKAIALELAEQGYDIVINYLTSKKEAEALKNMIIDDYGVRCLAIAGDVSKEDKVDEMVSLIESKLGGVDILINNAAVDLSNLFHLKNAEEFRKTLDVNVVGAFNCSKRVYRHMIDQEYEKSLISLRPMVLIPIIRCVLIMMHLKLH